MRIDIPRIAAVGFVSCRFPSLTTSATSSLVLTPLRAKRCSFLPLHLSRSRRRPRHPLVFEIKAISTTPSPSDNSNSDSNNSDEDDQPEDQPPPISAQTFLGQLNSPEFNKQFDENQPTELGLRVSQSQGTIDFFFKYLTKGLTEDVDQYLSSPFRLVSIAAVALLFGFFAATSATTIIGSVADWDPLAAAVLLILTEGFTKFYYTRPNNSRLLQLVNAFKIGLIYGMVVDSFKLCT